MRSKKEQREYIEFELLFSVPVHCNHSDSHVIEALFGSAFIDGFRCRAAESEQKGEPSRIRFQKSVAKI